jgi:hypothetical protein
LTSISGSAIHCNSALSWCCFDPTATSRDLVRYNHVKRNSDVKKLSALLAASLCMLGFSGVSSATSVSGATITSLGIFQGIGDYLFISVNQTPSGVVCTNSFQYVLNLSTTVGQQTMAVLLAARASGLPVSITGNGSCVDNSETVVNVTY